MTVEQQLSYENDAAVLCPLTTLTSSDMDALMLRMDAGHYLLARYRRTQNSRDLNQSIKHFKRASDLCPVDHRYRPATLFNPDQAIALQREALALLPVGHIDRSKSLKTLRLNSPPAFSTEATTKTWIRLSRFTGKL
ncbi:hypothetical protein EDB19DRAFT_1916918 [Suillus lakei]|nr:hypothetical protein EDB19DRAFT_1916918 [Suillus lakei]